MYIALFTKEPPQTVPEFMFRYAKWESIVKISIRLPWFKETRRKTGSALEFAKRNKIPIDYPKAYQYDIIKVDGKLEVSKKYLNYE